MVELGDMESVAITDHGSLSNAFKFFHYAKENNIKPLIGVEAYLVYDKQDLKYDQRSHITLLAMNEEGWKNLLKLHTYSYRDYFYQKPCIDYEMLFKHNNGIICLSGCMASHVNRAIRANNYQKAQKITERMKSVFGDRYYIEIQRINVHDNDNYEDHMLSLAKEFHIKIVATNDVHFLKKEHHTIHEMLCCTSMGKTFGEDGKLTYSKELYLKSGDEMHMLFGNMPEAIESTLEISERCNLDLAIKRNLYPVYNDIPKELVMNTEEDTQNNYLYNLVKERYKRKIPERLWKDPRYADRVKHELNTIFQMGYSSYFLIVWDFVNWCEKNNIPIGPGRGSAGGSLVCYLLGITLFDPIKAELIFERFLNPGRVGSPPDIDTDISTNCRDIVIRYVFDKYGEQRCSMIGTFGTCKLKTLVRDGSRVLKIPLAIADQIAKSVPEYSAIKVDFEFAIKDSPKFAKYYEEASKDPNMLLLFQFIKEFEGSKHHASKHAAGVVIAPEGCQIDDFIPQFYDREKHIPFTAVDMGDVEQAGLLKMDFLGLDTLTQINEILELCPDVFVGGYYHFVDWIINECLDDNKVIETIFKNQNTLGVFQFEFEGMQGYMKQLGITEFEDLVILTSAARPGAKDFIPYMAECKYGIREPEYDDQKLEPILKRTWGVILYQEQAIQLFRDMAGFSLADADIARRAIGKKKAKLLEKLEHEFIEGSVRNGYSRSASKLVFDKIALHSGYSFNRSHAYAYSLISWMTAWLKTYYTSEFMSVMLTHGGMFKRYIEECGRLKIAVLPPSVNNSKPHFSIEKFDLQLFKSYCYYDELYGLIKAEKNQKVIRSGTGKIKDVPEDYDFSENGPYIDVEDFVRKNSKINSRIMCQLIYAGALDCFGIKRSVLYENIDNILKTARKIKKHENQEELFSDSFENDGSSMKQPDREWTLKELFLFELKVTDHCFIVNFKTAFNKDIKEYANGYTIANFNDTPANTHCIFIGIVYTKKWHKSKKTNKNMMFLNIGDFDNNAEVSVFDDALRITAERMKDEVSENLIKEGDVVCVNCVHQGSGKFSANYLKKVDISTQ
jgi:DNA polymerase-3 subunit alpha